MSPHGNAFACGFSPPSPASDPDPAAGNPQETRGKSTPPGTSAATTRGLLDRGQHTEAAGWNRLDRSRLCRRIVENTAQVVNQRTDTAVPDPYPAPHGIP